MERFGRITGSIREVYRTIYDIEITFMDLQIGRVLDELEQTGRLEKMVIVITADHGEGLGDHNWWTHGILYQEQVRVPLIIHAPSRPPGQKVDSLVRTIDIMPTMLELVGLDRQYMPPMEGQSLAPMLDGSAADPGYVAYCDSVNMLTYQFAPTLIDNKDDILFAVTDGEWKYIHHLLRADESELYHLASDPREQNNLMGARPNEAARLQANLRARDFLPDRLFGLDKMSPEDRLRLRSLGYVD
jgi:choline-sulfatase